MSEIYDVVVTYAYSKDLDNIYKKIEKRVNEYTDLNIINKSYSMKYYNENQDKDKSFVSKNIFNDIINAELLIVLIDNIKDIFDIVNDEKHIINESIKVALLNFVEVQFFVSDAFEIDKVSKSNQIKIEYSFINVMNYRFKYYVYNNEDVKIDNSINKWCKLCFKDNGFRRKRYFDDISSSDYNKWLLTEIKSLYPNIENKPKTDANENEENNTKLDTNENGKKESKTETNDDKGKKHPYVIFKLDNTIRNAGLINNNGNTLNDINRKQDSTIRTYNAILYELKKFDNYLCCNNKLALIKAESPKEESQKDETKQDTYILKELSFTKKQFSECILNGDALNYELWEKYREKKIKEKQKEKEKEKTNQYNLKLRDVVDFRLPDDDKSFELNSDFFTWRIAMVILKKNDNIYKILTSQRSDEVFSYQKYTSIVPSGYAKIESDSQTVFKIHDAALKELREEVFNNSNRKEVNDFFEKKPFTIENLGVVIDLVTLNPTFALLMKVDDDAEFPYVEKNFESNTLQFLDFEKLNKIFDEGEILLTPESAGVFDLLLKNDIIETIKRAYETMNKSL